MNTETIALVCTIITSVIGGTWVLSNKLSTISASINALVDRVNRHEAEIIDLKSRRNRARR